MIFLGFIYFFLEKYGNEMVFIFKFYFEKEYKKIVVKRFFLQFFGDYHDFFRFFYDSKMVIFYGIL